MQRKRNPDRHRLERATANVQCLAVLLAPGLSFASDISVHTSSAFPILGAVAVLIGALALTWRRHEHRWKQRRIVASTLEETPDFENVQVRELLDLASNWQWQTDQDHRYVRLSAGFSLHAGLDPTSSLGHPPWELSWNGLHDDAWGDYRARLGKHELVQINISHHDTAGRWRHLEIIGTPLYRNGRFVGYHGVGRDITARVTAERSLEESRTRYRELVDSISEVIFRADSKGNLTFVNAAWEALSGRGAKEALNTRLVEYLHPDDRVAAWHHMSKMLRGELKEFAAQLRLHRRDGEVRWIELAMHTVTSAKQTDDTHGIAGTLVDISSRKVAEMTLRNINRELEERVRTRTTELEASNRELEAFSYSVSHDLRAPLRTIDGFARILEEELDERLNDTARSHIDRIRKAAGRMARLIDSLIELAQLTRHPLRKETFDLSELAIQIIEELRSEEPGRKVDIEITSDLTVTADKALIEVALENLLRNAWKFSSGRESALIKLKAFRDHDKRVFCVSDNGVGFDMAFAANLFRPFHRLHGTAEFAGFGIGLANAARIIQRHGGKIWAESRLNEGAEFFFTLSN